MESAKVKSHENHVITAIKYSPIRTISSIMLCQDTNRPRIGCLQLGPLSFTSRAQHLEDSVPGRCLEETACVSVLMHWTSVRSRGQHLQPRYVFKFLSSEVVNDISTSFSKTKVLQMLMLSFSKLYNKRRRKQVQAPQLCQARVDPAPVVAVSSQIQDQEPKGLKLVRRQFLALQSEPEKLEGTKTEYITCDQTYPSQ